MAERVVGRAPCRSPPSCPHHHLPCVSIAPPGNAIHSHAWHGNTTAIYCLPPFALHCPIMLAARPSRPAIAGDCVRVPVVCWGLASGRWRQRRGTATRVGEGVRPALASCSQLTPEQNTWAAKPVALQSVLQRSAGRTAVGAGPADDVMPGGGWDACGRVQHVIRRSTFYSPCVVQKHTRTLATRHLLRTAHRALAQHTLGSKQEAWDAKAEHHTAVILLEHERKAAQPQLPGQSRLPSCVHGTPAPSSPAR